MSVVYENGVTYRLRWTAFVTIILGAFPTIRLGAQPSMGSASTGLHYPPAHVGERTDTYFGTTVRDPYRWLEDSDSPETRTWVRAEDSLTFGYLRTIPERAAIKRELTRTWNFPKYSAPQREGGKLFFTENTGLQYQNVAYVQDSPSAPRRVLLDPNTLSADGHITGSVFGASPDGRYVAWASGSGGSNWYELHVRTVATAHDLTDRIRWLRFGSFAWSNDNRGFFYSGYDRPSGGHALTALSRGQKLKYHRLGTPQSADVVVYERPDEPLLLIDGTVTADGRYLLIDLNQGSHVANRVYYKDLGDPQQPTLAAPMVKLLDDRDATYRFIEHDGPTFYFETDRDAPRGQVIAIDITHPATRRTVIPESADALASVSVRMIGGRLVAEYLHDAHTLIRMFTLDGAPAGELPLPGIGSARVARDSKPGDSTFYYEFSSFLSPLSIYRYDLRTGTGTLYRAPHVDFDPSAYETTQVFFQSKDGTRIPMFITARKGLTLDGSHPTLLSGYGGFSSSSTPYFQPGVLEWLKLGGIYAVAGLRGGGEYGKAWHEAGMLANKQHSFDDFIAAAEYLIKTGYTSTPKLAIQGESNGGLLVGAVLTQRPDLFGAALPGVGLMDMLRYHTFTIGSHWVSEYGSSADSAQFRTLYAYSPLHHIKPGTAYPPTLITTADHDDTVVPAHSFKFAAALQAAQAGAAPILIRIETQGGHGGGTTTAKQIDQWTDELAFLVKNIG